MSLILVPVEVAASTWQVGYFTNKTHILFTAAFNIAFLFFLEFYFPYLFNIARYCKPCTTTKPYFYYVSRIFMLYLTINMLDQYLFYSFITK